jgi:hypothetical protein
VRVADFHARPRRCGVDLHEHEPQIRDDASQAIAVGAFQRGAGQNGVGAPHAQFSGQEIEPAGAIGVGQRNPAPHLLAVGLAVVRIAFDQLRALGLGDRGAKARFAAAGHAHDDHRMFDHRSALRDNVRAAPTSGAVLDLSSFVGWR